MTIHSSRPSARRPSPAAILLVPLAVAIVLILFAWPNARLEPRDLPIGVAGPAAAAGAIEHRLGARDGAFDVERYRDEAAAREAIEAREIYGAFLAGPAAPKVLIASAASPAVAQMLSHAAVEQGAATDDVVSAGPRGAALGSSVLPLVIAGILTGAAGSGLASGALGRAGLVLAASVLGGLVATAIVQSWLEVIEGSWSVNAAAISLTIAALGAAVAGAKALFGHAGAALTALTMVLIGNPFSGMAAAPELLPEPAGGLGQLLPPGAGGNLVRSTGFFDGAAAGGHVAVLACWVLAGFALLWAAALREGRRVPAAAPAFST